MRLSQEYIQVFKQATLLQDEKAKLYLFGSRTDDTKRGGDIDLLIISNKIGFDGEFAIRRYIFDRIEEQKIDITLSQTSITNPFVKVILPKAILL